VSSDIDLTLLGKMLGMLGSRGDGEALNAARLANKLVRLSGRTWADFIEAFKVAETATAAAAELLAIPPCAPNLTSCAAPGAPSRHGRTSGPEAHERRQGHYGQGHYGRSISTPKVPCGCRPISRSRF
jgi:hypothetical protein